VVNGESRIGWHDRGHLPHHPTGGPSRDRGHPACWKARAHGTRGIANILRALDDASRPEDMNLPGFRFHPLAGRDKGRYAVSASGNWRTTFVWIEGDATHVDLEDYH
jgi:toxin HigB-1